MAATSTEAVLLELEQEGCAWIKSERYHKMQAEKQKDRERNNPMTQCVLKFDHFENIHRLPKELPTFDGSPNFRQVPGYLVFGTGQPTKTGFHLGLKYKFEVANAKKVLWTNMRQEPVIYLNGQSFTPRLPDRMNENMEFPELSGDDIEWMQESLVKTVLSRIEESKADRKISKEQQGKVQYYRDTYAEHPEDRQNIEHAVILESDDALCTLSGMYDQLRHLGFNIDYARLPIVDEKAPRETDFDHILEKLKVEPEDTACIFNCQMGKGRTTTGMILACLVKDLVHGDPNKKHPKLEKVDRAKFPNEDEYAEECARRGQFLVVERLFKFIPEAKEAKDHLDHIIDLCGEPPKGTGLQNLRECIIWTKQKFDFEPKAKKAFWRQMSMNFIERYCYLLCFATYAKEQAKHAFEKPFTLWMDERAEIREVIYSGTKEFEWK